MNDLATIEDQQALEKLQDGDVICYNGIDLYKVGNDLIPLEDVLSWDGLEEALRKLPQMELPVIDTFSGGVYIREMHIPKGTFIIGKRHRHETCNVMIKGIMSLYLGTGKPVEKIGGPLIFTSEPMTRKIAYTHEDTIFLNIHPTDKQCLDDVEKDIIISEQDYMENIKCLGEL